MEVETRCFRPIKVAIVEPVGGHGGMNYYDFGLCEGLSKADCEVTLYTCDETEAPEGSPFTVSKVYRRIYGDDPAWVRGMRYALGSIRALFSCVKSGTNICHFHFFHVGVMEAFNIALAKLLLRRVVITAHDVEPFVQALSVPRLALWVYRQADAVIAHNNVSKMELIDKLQVPETKISVIPHGNYLHMLQPLPDQGTARRKLGLPLDSKVMLFFGQIKDVKGLDLLLEAMPNILAKHPNALLLIAGKPWKSDFSSYERKMEELGIRDACITHIRYIPDSEVPFYYSAADLVVLPYRRIYQSGVLLMAMSYGKATIASNLPGMKEVITDGKSGLLFNSGNAGSLAERVSDGLNNMGKLTTIEKEALELMKRRYDWRIIGGATHTLYTGLVDA